MNENDPTDRVRAWHSTQIIDIEPGIIRPRGYPIEELIGSVSFSAMIWLMLRGELPDPAQDVLFEAVLVSAVDHGPQAPAISIARMASTCGVGINNAMASGINALGDVHGGAGTQCMELLETLRAADDFDAALADWREEHGRYLPGYGHRFHPVDPRAVRLGEMVDQASAEGTLDGGYLAVARKLEAALVRKDGKPLPMNIDGITAVVLLELGFPAGLGRGVFILSRSVGICAHAWEQSQSGGRIRGPTPPDFGYAYEGPAPRHLTAPKDAG